MLKEIEVSRTRVEGKKKKKEPGNHVLNGFKCGDAQTGQIT